MNNFESENNNTKNIADEIPADTAEAEQKQKYVQYYADSGFVENEDNVSADTQKSKSKKRRSWKTLPSWSKALIIIAAVIVCIGILTTGCNRMLDSLVSEVTDSLVSTSDSSVVTDFGYDYIGVVHIEGTISEDSEGTYNHQYILNSIDAMMNDSENKGMILYLDTPGGSVFASDELYFKIKEYQEKTGRPVYSSMQSMAASGGYYISAPCDKIIANRNCWTGSIGVTLGTMYDVSELLENLGIKTQTITSGANKAMGSSTDAMTAEQKAIYQSMVDEAYEQFVGIVAEGRDMKVSKVKELADGRIYTAKQALENGLIDKIGTFEEAVEDMKQTYKLNDCETVDFQSTVSSDWTSLLGQIKNGAGSSSLNADSIEKLIELNGKFEFSYICQIDK